MDRVRLKRVEVDKPRCTGCYFHRPDITQTDRYDGRISCEKRNLRSAGHNLRDLFDCDDFRCELDMTNFIFIIN